MAEDKTQGSMKQQSGAEKSKYWGNSQSAVRNCGERSNNYFRHETKSQPIETNTSEKNNEAKANYFSATAGLQAKNLPIQTLENAIKCKNKSGTFQELESVFLKSHYIKSKKKMKPV